MFWITVGHARRQTARAIGPSTIDRSNFDDLVDGGWIERFYNDEQESQEIRRLFSKRNSPDLLLLL